MINRKSVSNFVLLSLEKTVDGYVRFEDFAYHHYRYHYGIPELKKSALSRALKRLRENGLIDFVDDNRLVYRLTDQGRQKVVLAKLLIDDQKWDGKWRILIFDIPEKRRVARDVLRSKLKAWGFIRWQQSVWVTKKNCAKELGSFIRSVGIEDWVKVFEADEIKI